MGESLGSELWDLISNIEERRVIGWVWLQEIFQCINSEVVQKYLFSGKKNLRNVAGTQAGEAAENKTKDF